MVIKEKDLAELSQTHCEDDFSSSMEYIKSFAANQREIGDFLAEYRDYFVEQYPQSEYDSLDNLLKDFPIFGSYTEHHSFRRDALYRHMRPNEPQLTKALSKFLQENPRSCRAFLQAVLSLLGQSADNLPSSGYSCSCEIITNGGKFIDNIIMWSDGALSIEVKFDAKLENDLHEYKAKTEEIAVGKNKFYVVISISCVEQELREKGYNEWSNIFWRDVLRLWEQNIAKQNIFEDVDMKRFRSALWNKILYREN